MHILPNWFRSLLLTVLLSFMAPIVLLGGLLAFLLVVSYIPGINLVGHLGTTALCKFLAVFGTGYPLHGIVTIGLTFSLVGGLLDLFNLYKYESYSHNS
jgi:hypothetical protein